MLFANGNFMIDPLKVVIVNTYKATDWYAQEETHHGLSMLNYILKLIRKKIDHDTDGLVRQLSVEVSSFNDTVVANLDAGNGFAIEIKLPGIIEHIETKLSRFI